MEELNEQMNEKTQPAEAEEIKGEKESGVSLGKFKDVNALLNAYNSLQAEFTKRSQRLKELEGLSDGDKTAVPQSEIEVGNISLNATSISEENKEDILRDYLKGVLCGKQRAVVMSDAGVGVKTPGEKPKTVAEAGMLAREIL